MKGRWTGKSSAERLVRNWDTNWNNGIKGLIISSSIKGTHQNGNWFTLSYYIQEKKNKSFLQHTRITIKKATFGVDLGGTQIDETFSFKKKNIQIFS
jgi:hypothetical protein